MTSVYEGTHGIEVPARYRPRNADPCPFFTIHKVPIGLIVPSVEHYTVVQLKIGRLDRELSAFQVLGSCHDIANARTDAGSHDARVLQLSEADRDVNILRDQVEEEIRDEEIDSDPRLSFQEPREELQEGRLAQDVSSELERAPRVASAPSKNPLARASASRAFS